MVVGLTMCSLRIGVPEIPRSHMAQFLTVLGLHVQVRSGRYRSNPYCKNDHSLRQSAEGRKGKAYCNKITGSPSP